MLFTILLWGNLFGNDSGGSFWKKDFLPLFLLDGAFYGTWQENQIFFALAGTSYCFGEGEMCFL